MVSLEKTQSSGTSLESAAKPARKVAPIQNSSGAAACQSAEEQMKDVPEAISQMLCEFLAVGRVDKAAPVLNLQNPTAIQTAFKVIGKC